MKLYISTAGLRKIEQAVDHFSEFLCPCRNHLYIIANNLTQFFLLDQFQISHHRRQRCFQVMGHIGNQIHAQLIATRHLFQTFFLNFQCLCNPFLIHFLHSRHHLIQPSRPEFFQQNLCNDKLNQNGKHHHISGGIIMPPV